MRPKIVIAYDATPAAADGLVLGACWATSAAPTFVARVLPHTDSTRGHRARDAGIVPRHAA